MADMTRSSSWRVVSRPRALMSVAYEGALVVARLMRESRRSFLVCASLIAGRFGVLM